MQCSQLFEYMFQFNLFTLMSISNKIILIIPTQHSRPKIHLQPNKFIISSTRIVSTVIEGLKCIFIIFFGKPKWMSMFSQCNIFAVIYKCKQNMNNVCHVIGLPIDFIESIQLCLLIMNLMVGILILSSIHFLYITMETNANNGIQRNILFGCRTGWHSRISLLTMEFMGEYSDFSNSG